MSNMSFMLTQEQFLDGTKTVTRRLGWKNIKIGVVHQAVAKSQGLKRGEKVKVLGEFIPTSSEWELLGTIVGIRDYGLEEVVREGFPNMSPEEFVAFFMKTHRGSHLTTPVNRIEFKRVKP